jgi:predicted flap endonuclease-1-like 5' DNA nuclease
LAERTGIDERLILDWVNKADLERIKGVGPEYADLLQQARVNTVVELSNRNPENLYKKLLELNEKRKLVRKLPTQKQVEERIKQAKELPRVIEY